eukprot:gb/GECH01013250.1/.p1 GENE.gb/GECH01013250.1/~~gb/GECH01013250.1/.p1  ORF type:complete len:291 (+),score=78.31 gb/GECH01013250.1/:1-873(+)
MLPDTSQNKEQNPPSLNTIRLDVDQETRVGIITLNRPKRANSMTLEFFSEFRQAVTYMDRTSDVNCVVVHGDIDACPHFSSGLDISVVTQLMEKMEHYECQGRRGYQLLQGIQQMQETFSVIEKSKKPFLAAIHGQCIGGAVDLICACDLRYCSSDASFCVKEVDLAITADLGTIQRLPSIIGEGRARELTYTARSVDAEEAAAMGLVNRMMDDKHEMWNTVMDLAKQIAAKSPLTLAGIKSTFNYSRDHSVDEGLRYVSQWNSTTLMSSDLPSAISAAVRGEKPIFSRL